MFEFIRNLYFKMFPGHKLGPEELKDIKALLDQYKELRAKRHEKNN